MATSNAYAGRFVGNEFILPAQPLRQKKQEIQLSQEPAPEIAEVEPQTYTAPVLAAKPAKTKRISLSLRLSLLGFALVFSIGLVSATIMTLAHNNPVSAVGKLTSNLQKRIQVNLSHPVSFVQPPDSVVVESKNLSSDITNIASQSIAINLSFATVNPSTDSVAKWVTTSKGPKTGSTLLAINTNTINGYLSSLAKSYGRAPVSQVVVHHADGTLSIQTPGINGVTFTGINQAASSLSSQLLADKGAVVTLPSSIAPFGVVNVNQP